MPAEKPPRPCRIVACMVWFDEPLASLERCIRSIAEHDAADHLITSDGRWEAYGDGTDVASPLEQRDLVMQLAFELFPKRAWVHGIHGRPFASQIEKRAWVYNLARTAGDWCFVLDADEHVEACDPDLLRTELDATSRLVGLVASRTMFGPSAPQGVARIPRLFSTLHGLTVEHAHNGVRTLDGRFLAGDPAAVAIEPSIDVSAHLRTYHSQGAERSKEREQADRRYRRRRFELKHEGWPARRSAPA